MKLRLFSFIVFQVIAWTMYFNWENQPVDSFGDIQSSKMIQVTEVPAPPLFSSLPETDILYQLVLRNDGFFTKVNSDNSVESGIWSINYDIPSIILKSPVVDYKYRILNNSNENLQIELINSHEIIEARQKEEDSSRTLFSTFN